ncbi:Detected protein of unknown function [Hibiscus syriacus]|uniref:Disease resistance protein RPM1-like n=1 Tax=Hibiscus syriacus TaxID=106335 RepID=A0A6A2ZJA9_HIBSY|nr:Detected protein of unknown function [Hibiscus syriacus]
MASNSLDPFLGQLISTLENEASSLAGISNEIQEMKLLFQTITSFLVDADRAGENSETQKAWVGSIRDLAYQVEDAIDEYMYHLNRQRQCSFLHRTLHFPKVLLVRHKVATKLKDINTRMKSITERANQFGVQQLEERVDASSHHDPNWKNRLSEASLFFKDDDLVGIRKAQHELLGWLMNEEPKRTVVSVVGMGGSGKTTLVANTFNKQNVKQHFDFCTWITVSQQYAIEELFRSMVKDIYKQTDEDVPMQVDTMTYRALVETLVQFLQSRRYLIVLDDVWSIRFWHEINIALPEGMRGSRIMITTRKEDVAPFQSGIVSYIHRIQPLRIDEAWKLFCVKAFPNELGGCPSYLDSLARNLVEKCQGLPLAIAALGGLMSSKKSLAEWKRVHDNLNWELGNNPSLELVRTISLLSYHDLPFQLKHCFLYCCIFPEDYDIGRKRIIRLWMAEGFLEKANDTPLEVIAESYLMDLIRRNLLQVAWRNYFGRPKAFKMHDLIRDFALSISKEEKFVAVSDGKRGKKKKEVVATRFKVLDLENAPIHELPREFGDLFNLRYLNLSRTQVKELPKSIGRLSNLLTLLLNFVKIQKLPDEIMMLQNLRHLRASYLVVSDTDFTLPTIEGICVPLNICTIKSLQVLSYVKGVDAFLIKLKEMTQLRRLGLDGITEADEIPLCISVERMEHLHHLSLTARPQATLKLDALSSAPRHLEKLLLIGKLRTVPRWFNTLYNLKYLNLQWSELWEDALPHIQALPNLLHLSLLSNAFLGERLWFIEGFPKLKILEIMGCPQLNEILVERGAMPNLEELQVLRCRELRRLPYGWEHLTHLKEVRLFEVSNGLVESICGKVNNIPTSPYISLIRIIDDDNGHDHEVESMWICQILN